MSGSCPTSPFPAKCLLRSRNRNLSSSSMSGKKFSRAFGVHLWELEATYPPMTRAQFDPIYAFSLSQDGTYGTFTFTAHDRDTPQGVATGTPVVRDRQNLLTYSEQADNAAWSKSNLTVSANSATDPNGGSTADLLTENTAASTTHDFHQDSSVSFDTAQSATASIYVKANGRTTGVLYLTNSGLSVWAGNSFNLSGVTASESNSAGVTNGSASIISIGSSWYRISISAKLNGGTIAPRLFLRFTNGGTSYTGNGTSGIYVWGGQIDIHSNAGTYVTTTSAAVNTESQSGNTLYVGGFTASITGIMKAGDLLKINSSTKVYMVTADANSDASGVATLTIHPALISTPVDAETVTVSSVPFTVSLADDILESFTDQADVYTYAMKMVEAL